MSAEKDLTRFFKKLNKQFKDQTSTEEMTKLGNEAIELIVQRTRLGYGVKSSGQKRGKLKSLAPLTVEIRKEMKKEGQLSSLTNPKKSNLTATGQMLDSMTIKEAKKESVVIGPQGYRKDGLANEFVGNSVTKYGREFNNLSDTELKKIRIFYAREISSLLKKNNLN